MVYYVSYVLLSHKTRIFHENRFYSFYFTQPRFISSIYPIKTLYDITSLSNTRSTLSYPIHFIITTCLLITQSTIILLLLPIKDEMTTSLTYKSYDQVHLTGLAAEYGMITEYEVTSKMYDTFYYLYESHLPFLNSESHFFFEVR